MGVSGFIRTTAVVWKCLYAIYGENVYHGFRDVWKR